jgi:membrane-bound serine protease (ClpP class)
MVLQPVESRLQPPLIRLGAEGVAVSELRPMGTCQFGDERVEVRSDLGIIPAGKKVKVVNIESGRLIVRPADQA